MNVLRHFEPWNLYLHQLNRDLNGIFTAVAAICAIADSGNAGNSVAEWVACRGHFRTRRPASYCGPTCPAWNRRTTSTVKHG